MWNEFSQDETQGTARQFTCKHHGWCYGLDSSCAFVQQELKFFDLDRSKFGLVPVRCEAWEGFTFVNLDDEGTTPLREHLGRFPNGLEGYPFDQMTQVYKYRTENWKPYIDALAEFGHAPVLHAKQYVGGESRKLMGYGYESLRYDIDGPHSMRSSWGGMAPPKDLNMVKPIEHVLRSGNFGPWDCPGIAGLDPLPSGINPALHPVWGLDSYVSSRTS